MPRDAPVPRVSSQNIRFHEQTRPLPRRLRAPLVQLARVCQRHPIESGFVLRSKKRDRLLQGRKEKPDLLLQSRRKGQKGREDHRPEVRPLRRTIAPASSPSSFTAAITPLRAIFRSESPLPLVHSPPPTATVARHLASTPRTRDAARRSPRPLPPSVPSLPRPSTPANPNRAASGRTPPRPR